MPFSFLYLNGKIQLCVLKKEKNTIFCDKEEGELYGIFWKPVWRA